MIHLSKLHWNILRNLRSLAWISSSDIFFFFLSLVWALGWSFVGPGRKNKKQKKKIKLFKYLLLGSFSSQLSCWQTITKSLKCRKTVEHLQTALTNQSNQSALWANSWIDNWFFRLCLMLSGLGNWLSYLEYEQ